MAESTLISAHVLYELHSDEINKLNFLGHKDSLLVDMIELYKQIAKTPLHQLVELRAQTSCFFAKFTWCIGTMDNGVTENCLLSDRFANLAKITVAIAFYYNSQLKQTDLSDQTTTE